MLWTLVHYICSKNSTYKFSYESKLRWNSERHFPCPDLTPFSGNTHLFRITPIADASMRRWVNMRLNFTSCSKCLWKSTFLRMPACTFQVRPGWGLTCCPLYFCVDGGGQMWHFWATGTFTKHWKGSCCPNPDWRRVWATSACQSSLGVLARMPSCWIFCAILVVYGDYITVFKSGTRLGNLQYMFPRRRK